MQRKTKSRLTSMRKSFHDKTRNNALVLKDSGDSIAPTLESLKKILDRTEACTGSQYITAVQAAKIVGLMKGFIKHAEIIKENGIANQQVMENMYSEMNEFKSYMFDYAQVQFSHTANPDSSGNALIGNHRLQD